MDVGPSKHKSAALCLILGISLLAVACRQGETQAAGPNPNTKGGGKKGGDVPVTIAKATERDVPLELEIIGNVEASSIVVIKPQVGGELVKVLFKEGEFVSAGQPLFEVDRRALEAQLAQATANLSRSEALNRQATANVGKSKAQLAYMNDQAARYAQLAKEGVLSKDQNEQAQATARAQMESVAADQAAIESTRADINAQRAMIDSLKVQLGFTQIKSPIHGRTGTLLVKPGNIVSANTTELVQINQLQPVFVSFAIPEARLRMVEARYGKGAIPVVATPQDGGGDAAQGQLSFYDNTVDPTTGTIRLRATFPNPDKKLWPGEFVRVKMRLGSDANAIVVPNQAVQTGQDGQFVFVVKEDRSVEMRTVTTAARSGQDLVIASGLSAGETVVAEGQMRLAPGMKVIVRDGRSGGGGRGGKQKQQQPDSPQQPQQQPPSK